MDEIGSNDAGISIAGISLNDKCDSERCRVGNFVIVIFDIENNRDTA
jgi:hypothetical protein